ncbi:MAG TPA: protein-glutamate O-methyltransferase CheR [Herpetosiphonaceae bacterium]|nr:protein-glutamate O-methyltransferase CheR [Herpetosiphonaceae bacterium]
MYTDILGLPESVFRILRDLIHQRTGMFYDDSKRDMLAGKLAPHVLESGFASFLDYYYLLKYGPGEDAEWAHVLNLLSVPETFFWREIDQIQALVRVVVPRLIAQGSAPVRIWSAACASGEEPLTIAMALDEAGLLGSVAISASDASTSAIEKARAGLYRERSFRALPPHLQARYFIRAGDAWRVDPELHRRISWHVANITCADEIAGLGAAPVVFCRNAFIYFGEPMVRKTVELFWQAMPSPGYLFLGAAESLLRLSTRFELAELERAFVYVK